MDLTYPPLVGLPPATAVAHHWADCERALQALHFRLFVRGAVQSGLAFPYGREYRLFCYRGAVITKAYDWEGAHPFGERQGAELDCVEKLAKKRSDGWL